MPGLAQVPQKAFNKLPSHYESSEQLSKASPVLGPINSFSSQRDAEEWDPSFRSQRSQLGPLEHEVPNQNQYLPPSTDGYQAMQEITSVNIMKTTMSREHAMPDVNFLTKPPTCPDIDDNQHGLPGMPLMPPEQIYQQPFSQPPPPLNLPPAKSVPSSINVAPPPLNVPHLAPGQPERPRTPDDVYFSRRSPGLEAAKPAERYIFGTVTEYISDDSGLLDVVLETGLTRVLFGINQVWWRHPAIGFCRFIETQPREEVRNFFELGSRVKLLYREVSAGNIRYQATAVWKGANRPENIRYKDPCCVFFKILFFVP